MNKNLGKKAAEAGAEDPERKRPHVSEGPNSSDDDFVLADFVRDAHTGRCKDCFPSKSQPKRPYDDGNDDADADSDGEADVVPKWKVLGDIVYYRPAAVLCGNSDAGPNSHDVFFEPICSQLPTHDDESPPTRGFTARQMFDNRSSSEHTFVGGKKHEEIDELLVKPRDENVEVRQLIGVVHVDVKQGGCVVAGGDDVNASLSVAVDSAEPSLAQESQHAVAPSQHEDADVLIEKPLENDVPADSVAGSPICLASNVAPDVFRVEPHVTMLSEDIVVVRTIENPYNTHVATIGQCSEVVVVSSQSSGETILVRSKEKQYEESDTEDKCFVSNSEVEDFLIHFLITMSSIWNGGSVPRSVKLMLSSKAEGHVDKKDMILMLCCKDGHYTVYTMNQHHETIDIHDTRRYIGNVGYTTKWHRSDYPSDCTEVPAVEDWKAKYIFQLLFNPVNLLYNGDMSDELQDLILLLAVDVNLIEALGVVELLTVDLNIVDLAVLVVAVFIQEAAVDGRTLRTCLLCRIRVMSTQYQSTSDEVHIIRDAVLNVVEECLEEIGGGATKLLSQKVHGEEKTVTAGPRRGQLPTPRHRAGEGRREGKALGPSEEGGREGGGAAK
ncbi:hypothetical protein ZWY2020_013918 [Hordeum vulgare]|nr:hypothetical protein ZWY2020_013918 [Hordeum vulgare]